MKPKNKLGIWMDHSIAHLMEFRSKRCEVETIESAFTDKKIMEALAKGESYMHYKEKKQLADYYKKVGETIKNYKRIILFGPTNAKVELFDLLSEDFRFFKIKIEIKETEIMTEHQQHDFVREYFSKA